jgi:predicted TIM-barrel fold metal-dependent hydrolase
VTIGRDFENVYLDLCASAAGYGVVERFVADVGAHKVLFGSDAGFLSAAQQIGRVALARITEEEKRAVLGLNAQRVLGLASVGPPPEGKEAQP